MKIFNLFMPKNEKRLPLIASLPHSGDIVPSDVEARLKKKNRPALVPVDWHLEKLYNFLPELGIAVIQATCRRYVVNLNRGLEEPRFGPEIKSVIPRETVFRRELYDRDLNEDEIQQRIVKYYTPYHRRLLGLIKGAIQDFGRAYLLDLHSYFMGPQVDVCLGNVGETTCSENLIGGFERALTGQSFRVVRNEVWTGGYITRHYGNMENAEALQIELRFPAYLDGESFGEEEITGWDSEKFSCARERLRTAFGVVLAELFNR